MWWADRLMGWLPGGPHELLDPFPVMAIAASVTDSLLLGTAVTDPLRRHPGQLAQTALTLQHLSRGRLVLGVGCGEVAGTVPYGIPYERPVAKLEEALAVLRALWSGDIVDREGAFYPLHDAVCGLGHGVDAPPVWIAAHGPRMLRITGEVGDGWLPTVHGAASYRAQLDTIQQASIAAGRAVDSVEPGAFVWFVAADSRKTARRLMHEHALRALGLLLPAGALRDSPLADGPFAHLVPTNPEVDALADAVDPDALAEVIPHGSPDEIADDLARYVEAGCRHLVLCDMSGVAGRDNGLGMRSLDLHTMVRDGVLARTAALADLPPPIAGGTR
jgi:phthiodiolone/phenolphthiodiolone dimycocerosates ketoreductase